MSTRVIVYTWDTDHTEGIDRRDLDNAQEFEEGRILFRTSCEKAHLTSIQPKAIECAMDLSYKGWVRST